MNMDSIIAAIDVWLTEASQREVYNSHEIIDRLLDLRSLVVLEPVSVN